jgi:hypothetical protein
MLQAENDQRRIEEKFELKDHIGNRDVMPGVG